MVFPGKREPLHGHKLIPDQPVLMLELNSCVDHVTRGVSHAFSIDLGSFKRY